MNIDIVNTTFIDVTAKRAGLLRAASDSSENNTFINLDNVRFYNTKASKT